MIYPGIDTKMLGGYTTPLVECRGMILHIAVSNSWWPSYLTGTAAHFYARKNGSVGQQVDSRMRGGSNYEGNRYYHAMETEGGVGEDVNGIWTDAQMEGMARVVRLSSEEHGWPLRLMGRSDEQGLGWHRLGINGGFPALPDVRAGRLQRGGGLLFSKAYGKTCPTDPRILQIPTILEIARGGMPSPVTPMPPIGQRTLYLGEPYLFGADVKAWQETLNRLDPLFAEDLHVTADSWFGQDTDLKTIRFQAATGLLQDGDVGPDTRAKAEAVLAGATPISTPVPIPVPAPAPPRLLDIDGDRGPATIGRWQEVMGTPVDRVISKPESSLIKADQRFLNAVVQGQHIRNLTGKWALVVDGDEGRNTHIVRQFWLRNAMNPQHQINLIGGLLAFDGDWGVKSTKVLQFALNNARTGSGRYGQV